jgi:hypothetical protein
LVYRAQTEEDELHLANWYTELRQRKMNYTWPTGIQSSDRGRLITPGKLVYRAETEEDEFHLANLYTELRQRKMNYTWPTGIQSSG